MSASLDHVRDLADFVTASPTSFHAAAEGARRLVADGFVAGRRAGGLRRERRGRTCSSGTGRCSAWRIPTGAGPGTPYRIVGAHTDSPGFVLKPRPDIGTAGWQQLGMEIYGGPLLNSWLDRELGLAGRVILTSGEQRLVRTGAIMRIPQLAIHLDRSANEEGVKLDRQLHTAPVWSVNRPDLTIMEQIALLAGCEVDEIDGSDLSAYATTPPEVFGPTDEFLASGRLDNLSSVHAAADRADRHRGQRPDHRHRGVRSRGDRQRVALRRRRSRARRRAEPDLRLARRLTRRPPACAGRLGLPVRRHRPRRPPELRPAARSGQPAAAQRRPAAQDQRQPAVRDRRGRRGPVAAGLPGRGGGDPGVRVQQRRALWQHHRPADRHPAGDPHGRRRHPAALDALGPRAGRRRRPARAEPGDRASSSPLSDRPTRVKSPVGALLVAGRVRGRPYACPLWHSPSASSVSPTRASRPSSTH